MAFPTAASITYKTFKNSALSIGKYSPSFIDQAVLGAMEIDADIPTLDIGSSTGTLEPIWQDPFEGALYSIGSSSNTSGWIDNTAAVTFASDFVGTSGLQKEGNDCYVYHFPAGSTGAPQGTGIRHNIAHTDELDVTFWYRQHPIFPSSNSNGTHLSHGLTTLDTETWTDASGATRSGTKYQGFSLSHCTLYMECERDVLFLGVQNREASPGTRTWVSVGYGTTNLNDDQWHKIRVTWKMNTYNADGSPNSDGVVRGWVDDKLEIENTAYMISTQDLGGTSLQGTQPKFSQIAIAPYWQLPISSEDCWIMVDSYTLNIPGSGADTGGGDTGGGTGGATAFAESFDSEPLQSGLSNGLWSRGDFYRNTSVMHTGTGCYQYFLAGGLGGSATQPDGSSGDSIRRNFPETDEVDFTAMVRLEGSSTMDFHQHLFYLMTTMDVTSSTPQPGPTPSYCTFYSEIRGNRQWQTAVQDLKRTNGAYRGDGDALTGMGPAGSSLEPGRWYKVRTYVKLNTWNADGTYNADGIVKVWIDDVLTINKPDVDLNRHDASAKFNQFLIGPYFTTESGDRTVMVDELSLSITSTADESTTDSTPASATGRNDPAYDPPASTNWRWVDNVNGLDSNTGETKTSAWKNLDVALSRLRAGDGLYLVEGQPYTVSTDAAFNSPALQPGGSGLADAPIVISAQPGFVSKPIIRRTANGGPMMGTDGQDHIWFVDLELDSNKFPGDGLALWNTRGSRVIRCAAHGAEIDANDSSPGSNLQAIRLENATECHVYGCDIYDVRNTQNSSNATCLKLYGAVSNKISYCDFWDASFGIMDKGHESNPDTVASPYQPPVSSTDPGPKCGSYNNVIEYNRFRSSIRTGYGILVQRSADFYKNVVRFNLFECYGSSFGGDNSTDNSRDGVYDFVFYNNTFYGYGNSGAYPNGWGYDYDCYNNIYWTSSTSNRTVPDIFTSNEAASWRTFTNNGFRHSAYIVYGRYRTDIAYDDNGAVSASSLEYLNDDIMFVSPSTGDYRLAAGSPAITAGTNGTYLGAFPDDSNLTTWAWW